MVNLCLNVLRFQSTLSARRATDNIMKIKKKTYIFQSTLSARRATRSCTSFVLFGEISIHALREESDLIFNGFNGKNLGISIHALREESDKDYYRLYLYSSNFNPRSPRGERPFVSAPVLYCAERFQSTLSARRATLFFHNR